MVVPQDTVFQGSCCAVDHSHRSTLSCCIIPCHSAIHEVGHDRGTVEIETATLQAVCLVAGHHAVGEGKIAASCINPAAAGRRQIAGDGGPFHIDRAAGKIETAAVIAGYGIAADSGIGDG